MLTINNDENILIIDQIKLLIDHFNQKKITEKYPKNKLIFYAKSHGFINNTCRKSAWSLLINSSTDEYLTGYFFSKIKLNIYH
jgi:hypothetical protein